MEVEGNVSNMKDYHLISSLRNQSTATHPRGQGGRPPSSLWELLFPRVSLGGIAHDGRLQKHLYCLPCHTSHRGEKGEIHHFGLSHYLNSFCGAKNKTSYGWRVLGLRRASSNLVLDLWTG